MNNGQSQSDLYHENVNLSKAVRDLQDENEVLRNELSKHIRQTINFAKGIDGFMQKLANAASNGSGSLQNDIDRLEAQYHELLLGEPVEA